MVLWCLTQSTVFDSREFLGVVLGYSLDVPLGPIEGAEQEIWLDVIKGSFGLKADFTFNRKKGEGTTRDCASALK